MEYREFRRQLGKADITIAEMADLIKLNPKSISNYSKRGTVPSNLAVIATLMGHMADNKLDFKEALQKIEISPNRIRGGAKSGQFGGHKNKEN